VVERVTRLPLARPRGASWPRTASASRPISSCSSRSVEREVYRVSRQENAKSPRALDTTIKTVERTAPA